MRLFELRRTEDESGVSGVGTVAQGVIFDNGWVALTWLTNHTSVAFYTSIEEVITIHGHGGKTKAVQIANCDMEEVSRLLRLCAVSESAIGGVFALFHEMDLAAGTEEPAPKEKKYTFKELFEVTEKERREIYEYAMKRSDEIIRGVAQHATEVVQEFLSGRKQ